MGKTDQEIIDLAMPYIPKGKQSQFIRDLGYYANNEVARLVGCSKQYVSKIAQDLEEKIFFNGRWWFKPFELKTNK